MKLQNKTSIHFIIFLTVSKNRCLQTQKVPRHSGGNHWRSFLECTSSQVQSHGGQMDGSRLTFDRFYPASSFLINCWIRLFTRGHKCRQMSRKCQGLGQEGDSGFLESVQAHKRQWGLSSSIPAEPLGATLCFLIINTTTVLQCILKEINKAGRHTSKFTNIDPTP